MMHTVLAIGGLDPSGGAGLLADIKTISAFGCYGVSVETSVTFQNTLGVFGARHLSREDIRSQMEPLLADFDVAAVKTGMLPTSEIIEEVASWMARLRGSAPLRLVVDPVAISTSGYRLAESSALDATKRLLFPLATIVTPNCQEAAALTGLIVCDRRSMEAAGKEILRMGPSAVLVTGGDLMSGEATDVLIDASRHKVFSVARLESTSTHGTGCTLASALACRIAGGDSLDRAVSTAKEYVTAAIRSGPPLGHGHGPLNHVHSRVSPS